MEYAYLSPKVRKSMNFKGWLNYCCICAVVVSLSALLYACTDTESDSDPTASQEEADQSTELMSLAELMDPHLNVASEVYWDNAGFIDTYEETIDLTPTTEEGWLSILNASTEIDRLSEELKNVGYSQGRAGWNELAEALKLATQRGREAVVNRDGDELFQAGAQLYQVCVACHQTFWSNNRFTVE